MSFGDERDGLVALAAPGVSGGSKDKGNETEEG